MMATGTTEQNILFNERFIGVRAVRIIAIFAAIAAVSYGTLIATTALSGDQTAIVVLGFVVAVAMSLTVGMAIVLWIINRLTRSYLAGQNTTSNAE